MAETFDYVVVGAGSAGCVMAARLSEDPKVSVLLLEAGGTDSDLTLKMPVAFLKAVIDAMAYGMFDLDRLEGMILRNVRRDYFVLRETVSGEAGHEG